jgi:hypothetical protein
MYADGDVTARWKTANRIVIQYPFKAIYLLTRPIYWVLPWPKTRELLDEVICGLSWRWIEMLVVKNDEESNYPRAVAKFAFLGLFIYASFAVVFRKALGPLVLALWHAVGGTAAGKIDKSKRE